MGEATGHWRMALFYFDTLCQLAYMIYITNANAGINILSIAASCREYRLFITHNSQESVRPKTPCQLEKVEFGQLILGKIIKNVATRCQI